MKKILKKCKITVKLILVSTSSLPPIQACYDFAIYSRIGRSPAGSRKRQTLSQGREGAVCRIVWKSSQEGDYQKLQR